MRPSNQHDRDHQPDDADHAFPNSAERDALNAALHATGAETGFWDDQGRPAPWPDDIDQWTPSTGGPATHEPGEHPFQPADRAAIDDPVTRRNADRSLSDPRAGPNQAVTPA